MHARVTTMTLDPSKIDAAAQHFREHDLPTIEAMDGFKGFTLLVDRESGRVIGTSYWESEQALRATDDKVREARRHVAEEGGASGEPEVAVYEVAIDTEA